MKPLAPSPKPPSVVRRSRSAVVPRAGLPDAVPPIPAERLRRLRETLDEIRARCDVSARLGVDPVGVVHRYQALHDQELVALLASALAFGNVKALRAKVEDALTRLAPHPSRCAENQQDTLARLMGWRHRVYKAEDLAALLVGARQVQLDAGSLGQAFAEDFASENSLKGALVRFTDRIRREGQFEGLPGRGAAHILADPRGNSGCKRLLLFLRWMIRPADGIDLGLWSLPTAALLVPVDTHLQQLGRNLGFTTRKALSWRTTEEITESLRQLDRDDPVKYDFALCHLGMLQRCPSRRDVARCQGCGVKPVCRHWEPKDAPHSPSTSPSRAGSSPR